MQIITVFSVSNSTMDDLVTGVVAVTARRKAEDMAFAKSVGWCVEATWLDREDAPLRLHVPDEAVFSSELSYEDLSEVRHVVDIVNARYGGANLLLAPMALGRHIDHLVVRNAALELLEKGAPVVFYEDLPYAADFSLTEIDEYAAQLGDLARRRLELCAIETSVTLEEKIALLECYSSQLDTRTESRVRSHADRCGVNSVVERVWVPSAILPTLRGILMGYRS